MSAGSEPSGPHELHDEEPRHRHATGAGVCLLLFAGTVIGILGLPRGGQPLPVIARHALEAALPAFHTTEPVSAVVYGIRAMDTFGETFIFLAAVTSVVVLARHREHRRGFFGERRAAAQEEPPSGDRRTTQEREARSAEREEQGADRPGSPELPDAGPAGVQETERSHAMTVVVRQAVRMVVPFLAVAGCYLVVQGYSPGGGFPAGVVILGVALLVFTGFGPRRVRPLIQQSHLELLEVVAAVAIIVALGLGLPLAGSFAANWLPLTAQQTLRSGGIVQAFSLTEFFEVGAGLSLAVFSLLMMRHDWAGKDDEDEDDRDDS